ncbi:hypothetical protein Nepgr_020977 [Nepenthes gracilis]|uniref:Uncharacterized protein n=1 Tax=Nepenthes gracilis TaxID=150966 RepID=A0AAD3SYA4_NEPGR|nr:hypothetical protein Nepgr_020977 [Nepenthes gracilis]
MVKAAAADEGYFVQLKYRRNWNFIPSLAVDFANDVVPLNPLELFEEKWLRLIFSNNGLLLCVWASIYDLDSLHVVNPAMDHNSSTKGIQEDVGV